jgi:chaperonin GroEL
LVRRALENAKEPDEVAAYRILIKALEAPTRRLLVNAGCDEYELMPEINKAGPGCGYDVMTQRIVNMLDAGIADSAATVKGAVHSGIAGATLALTTDVLIHRKRPPESFDTA